MRIFYSDEAPIDTLLQIASGPIWDGDLVSKSDRDVFVRLGWVARCEGWNIMTNVGHQTVKALKLSRIAAVDNKHRPQTDVTVFTIPYADQH